MSATSSIPERTTIVDTGQQQQEKPSFKYSFAYERATLYEYKFERQAEADSVDPCLRCNKNVPSPDDMVNIGPDVRFHKQCFRCRICGMPLTQQTFYRNDRKNGSTDKEVYCKTHVGKTPGEIEGATITQTKIPGSNGGLPSSKYVIQIQGKSKKSGSPESSVSGRNMSPSSSVTANTMNGSGGSFTSITPNSFDYTSSLYNHSSRTFPHPKSVLVTFQDFDQSGVFEAQVHLEQRHKEEEERLQRFLSEEREKEMRRLDDSINIEKERAAAELLASIDQLSLQRTGSSTSQDLLYERQRIEEHFRRLREDRLKMVTDKLANDEKMRTSKMVERQGQEMMLLIAEKDREMDKGALFDHSMHPPILPPENKKAQLYRSPTLFKQLDERAIELANREYNNFTDLVRDLTRSCTTELEKVRVLFRWVIAKDLNRNAVKQILQPNASLSLLKGVKSGKESYHQLFKKLCSFAGLHCEIIIGFSKGAGYKPGMRIEGNAFRNSWTAVAIDGSWRFINCTWAARHISGHKDDLPQVFHTYDEFYFLTDPEDYIYQHYPDEPSWQLLEIPLPFSEFINLPVVKSPFFNYGLRFYSNYGASISTDSGLVEIRLIMPKILGFGSLLEPFEKTAADKKDMEGRSLLRLIKNEAVFTVSLPRPGIYYFSIYTGDYWHSECLESACSFLINCRRLLGPPAPPYPPVPFFGATPVLETLNIAMESHPDPLIVSNNDTMEILFKMDSDIKVTHSFQYFDMKDGSILDIDRYVFLRSRTEKGATYMIRCPNEGFYIFSLYAADSKDESQTLDCVYRYLVVSQEPNPSVSVFPKTYHRWQKCTLYEPLSGDLLTSRRYMFRLEVPRAVEVFVVNAEVWHHLKRRIGYTWEGNALMPNVSGVTKVYARFTLERDTSVFAHLLDYELVEDAETEI